MRNVDPLSGHRGAGPVARGAQMVAGALAVAVGARISVAVPGSPVPQSLQTLAVVLVGGLMGPRWGVAALAAYLVMGAAGLPVFADGGGGVAHLWGPTAGYLWGFLVGAGVAGWWAAPGRRGPGQDRWLQLGAWLTAGLVMAHGVILGMGWARLSALVGPGPAWSQGVAPFLWGGGVKSAVGAMALVVWWERSGGRGAEAGEGAPGVHGAPPVEPGSPAV